MRQAALFVIFSFFTGNIFSQTITSESKFNPPLDIPLILSGNFAELRTDHFHSGIDIKTQGVVGKKVYSIDDGYISRIKVQSNGYGYSLYINHPNGITSVYGHLSRYNEKIDNYVKAYLYKYKTFKADIFPKKNEFPVQKGELIAYSGNSGSSAGPHLHFEIRNTLTQYPQNALNYKFPVRDNIPPKIYHFYLYEFSGTGRDRVIFNRKEIPIAFNKGSYSLNPKQTLTVSNHVGFSIESYDFLNDAQNRCGIYSIEMFVDGELYFHFQTDEFGFNESRYINAFMDYPLKADMGIKAQKLFLMPNSKLSMYKYQYNNGVFYPEPGDTSQIDIYLKDINKNISNLSFKITGTEANELLKADKVSFQDMFKWYESNDFDNHVIRLHFIENCFYENLKFSYSRMEYENKLHPYIHSLANTSVAMSLPAELSLALTDSLSVDPEKLCIVSIDEEDGSHIYSGGSVSGNWIKTKISAFGKYTIDADTLSPQIIPVNITGNKNMKSQNSIRFIIRDNLSGINEFNGFIDNEWALFEYDAKNDLLIYYFDADRIQSNTQHELELYVTDNCNNTNLFHSGFFW